MEVGELESLLEGSLKCDFCAEPGVMWMYPAEDVDLVLVSGGPRKTTAKKSIGGWACCGPCKTLIDNGKPALVVKHITNGFVARNPRAQELDQKTGGASTMMIRKQVAVTYMAFRRVKSGPAFPFG